MKDYIDEILAARIAGEKLSEEEEVILAEWRKDEENREEAELFNRFEKSNFSINNHKDYIKGKDVFSKIENGALKLRRRSIYRKRLLYASFAASVAVVIGLVLFLNNMGERPEAERIQLVESISPGVPKAELVLPDGNVVHLEFNENRVISLADNLNVKTEDNTLIYDIDDVGSTEYNVLRVPRGAEFSLILSDGTKVYLNSDSELKYPVVFTGEEREVFLSGEGYFDVVKDTNRPFRVKTERADVKVLGTSFNVNAYEQNKEVCTTLESGVVQFVNENVSHVLKAGERLIFDKKTNFYNVEEVDTELYTSWKDGYYKFKNMTLEEIMNTLSMWYDLEVNFTSTSLKELLFTGRIKRYDDIVDLFRKFEQTDEIEFSVRGKSVIIKNK